MKRYCELCATHYGKIQEVRNNRCLTHKGCSTGWFISLDGIKKCLNQEIIKLQASIENKQKAVGKHIETLVKLSSLIRSNIHES